MENNDPEEGKPSKIQRLVMDYLEGVIDSSRDFEEKTGISHAMYHRYKDMKSKMTLTKLEHIISIFPQISIQVGNYLRGNTEKKLTGDGTDSDNEDLDELVDKQMLYIEQLHHELRRLRKRGKGDKGDGETASVTDN